MVVSSFARLSAFARGVVWGLHVAGWSQRDIAKVVRKTDGTAPTFVALGKAIARGHTLPFSVPHSWHREGKRSET